MTLVLVSLSYYQGAFTLFLFYIDTGFVQDLEIQTKADLALT